LTFARKCLPASQDHPPYPVLPIQRNESTLKGTGYHTGNLQCISGNGDINITGTVAQQNITNKTPDQVCLNSPVSELIAYQGQQRSEPGIYYSIEEIQLDFFAIPQSHHPVIVPGYQTTP
ncbi:MAG: hypothetical protein V1724_03980, partial [Chloroflexota bacterium]